MLLNQKEYFLTAVILYQALDGSLQENAYVVSLGSDCIIIHPGFDPTVQKKGSAGKTPILGEFNDLY